MGKGASRFLVTTARGQQPLLAAELEELGLAPRTEPSGAVTLSGDWATAARVLVRSRTASRVYLSVRRFSARTRAMLYDQVRRVDWPSWIGPGRTMAVEAAGSLDGTDYAFSYAPLRVKDAVCDEFRKRGLLRPDVDKHDPDVLLNAFFHGGRCELSLDLTGTPLHRRGYRLEGAEAPLREHRAAALLRLSGYDGSRALVDPFCGSGTIVIEAALMAGRVAPGLLRAADDVALWRMFPGARDVLEAERDAAQGERVEPRLPLTGSDLEEATLETARANAARAGVGEWTEFRRGDARELTAPDSFVVTNPPYGERLETPEAAAELLDAFTRRLKHHAAGSRLGLVLPRGPLERAVGLRPLRRLAVESGSLALRYACYDLRAGRYTAS